VRAQWREVLLATVHLCNRMHIALRDGRATHMARWIIIEADGSMRRTAAADGAAQMFHRSAPSPGVVGQHLHWHPGSI
jgi:hypothetical protein